MVAKVVMEGNVAAPLSMVKEVRLSLHCRPGLSVAVKEPQVLGE